MVALAVALAYLWQLGSALLDAVFDPGHHSVEHLLLAAYIQLVTGDYVNQLVGGQQHELLALHHLARGADCKSEGTFLEVLTLKKWWVHTNSQLNGQYKG